MNRALQAKIHIAKKDLGLSEEDYRDILFQETRKRSTSSMTDFQGIKVLKRLEFLGFVGAGSPRPAFPSTKEGLRKEVIALAKARFGEDFEGPLFNLINRSFNKKGKANGPVVTDIRLLNVAWLKAIKDVIIRLNKQGPYRRGDELA